MDMDAKSTGFGALSAAEHALSLGPFALVEPDTRHAPRSLAERSSELSAALVVVGVLKNSVLKNKLEQVEHREARHTHWHTHSTL